MSSGFKCKECGREFDGTMTFVAVDRSYADNRWMCNECFEKHTKEEQHKMLLLAKQKASNLKPIDLSDDDGHDTIKAVQDVVNHMPHKKKKSYDPNCKDCVHSHNNSIEDDAMCKTCDRYSSNFEMDNEV